MHCGILTSTNIKPNKTVLFIIILRIAVLSIPTRNNRQTCIDDDLQPVPNLCKGSFLNVEEEKTAQ